MPTLTSIRENAKEVLSHEPLLGTAFNVVPSVYNEIECFKFLEEGWDGEDADPISNEITSLAKLVVLEAFNKYLKSPFQTHVVWHDPEVTPTIDGGIDLEWKIQDRKILLFFNPNGNIEVTIKRNKEVLGSFAVPPEYKRFIQPQIDWVFGIGNFKQ